MFNPRLASICYGGDDNPDQWPEDVRRMQAAGINTATVGVFSWARLQPNEITCDFSCSIWCDIIHPEGAQALAHFTSDFYAGRPAITRNRAGEGQAIHVGTAPDDSAVYTLIAAICSDLNLRPPFETPQGVEVMQRWKDERPYTVVINHAAELKSFVVPEAKTDLITGRQIAGMIELGPWDLLLLV